MNCPSCQNPIPPNARFCPNCGAPVPHGGQGNIGGVINQLFGNRH